MVLDEVLVYCLIIFKNKKREMDIVCVEGWREKKT